MTTRSLTFPLMLMLVLTAGTLAFFIYYSPEFPQRIAIHFDLSGRANGWTDKLSFLVIGSAMSMMLPAFIVVCVGLLPRILPIRMVNLPNRDYWLAPERRRATLDDLLRRALWLGCLVQALLFSLDWQIARASIAGAEPRLGTNPFIVLAIFVVGLIAWGVNLTRSFRRP